MNKVYKIMTLSLIEAETSRVEKSKNVTKSNLLAVKDNKKEKKLGNQAMKDALTHLIMRALKPKPDNVVEVNARDGKRNKALPMNRPMFRGTTNWDTGETTPLKGNSPLWKKGAMKKHNAAMDEVLRKRGVRAEKKEVMDSLLAILADSQGRKDESTPSKMEIAAAKHLPGFTLRPEDDTELTKGDKGLKRNFIARRKEQFIGKPQSKGGVKRLKRKLGSHVFSPKQRAALKRTLKAKRAEGKARRDAKGKSDLFQDMGGTGINPISMFDDVTATPKKKGNGEKK